MAFARTGAMLGAGVVAVLAAGLCCQNLQVSILNE
jgi:hypothetical protein